MTEQGLRQNLRALLASNHREGFSGLLRRHYCYIAPSAQTYPFQWFWDSCFHVIMLVRLGDYEAAKRNLRSLFEMQEENGFVGHMIFWHQALPVRPSDVLQARPSLRAVRPHMSALIQPPFAAQALLRLFEACGDRVYLGELYAKVMRYHEWLAGSRDFDGDGLLSIISPFESGMDWKPTYDPVLGYRSRPTHSRLVRSGLYWRVMGVDLANFCAHYDLERIKRRRRFLVKDAGFNAIYSADLAAMEKLAGYAGDDASRYTARRQRVVASMLRLMYDARSQAFLDVWEPGSRKLAALTSTLFFPLVAPEVPQGIAQAIVDAHFHREDEFGLPWPLPTVARRDRAFSPAETKFLWRGPTWAFVNWFLYHAFSARGFSHEARLLKESLWDLVERSGFREYYDPFTGQGMGARDFTWSGLLLDMP